MTNDIEYPLFPYLLTIYLLCLTSLNGIGLLLLKFGSNSSYNWDRKFIIFSVCCGHFNTNCTIFCYAPFGIASLFVLPWWSENISRTSIIHHWLSPYVLLAFCLRHLARLCSHSMTKRITYFFISRQIYLNGTNLMLLSHFLYT